MNKSSEPTTSTILTIRCCSTLEDYHLEIENTKCLKVKELKLKLTPLSNNKFANKKFRLIYRGRTLDDDCLLFVDYKITDGSVLYLSEIKPKEINNTPNLELLKYTEDESTESSMLKQFSDNPLMKSISSNPHIIRSMMLSNPQMKRMVEKNPEISQFLNDPAFLKQSMKMAHNPKIMKEALKNNDRAISNLEMIPGGFNHLKKMYYNLHEPIQNSRKDQENETCQSSLLADSLGLKELDNGTINNEPLPNIWDRKSVQIIKKTRRSSCGSEPLNNKIFDMSTFPTLFNNEKMTNPPETNPIDKETDSDLLFQEEKFKRQLDRLKEMGFDDLSQNLRALRAAEGDVDSAVEWLLNLEQ